ncbi:MAG: mutL [Chloroflexi bacterium]|nr:mutL [Chloroflexota bacterium]
MPIRILSPEIASQIAAGEVVERPASVVKELLENSLDAEATFVSIKIEGAGQRLIEVTDNGSGISETELPIAVERHATSKLSTSQDLFHITTLGFRGEALASIGSVARLTITSRPLDADVGTRLKVDAGHSSPIEPVGAPVGTQVRVEDLFYNVPARLKFLKHETTERRLIDNLVTRYALAYPQVRFHLFQENKPALQTSGNGDRREILAALFGVEQARQMLDVLAQDDWMHVTGFISPTSLTRSHRRDITFFVNGRPVQDAALAAALLKGYHTLLMVGRYPIAVLFLQMPPELVDVNVHPAKAEVRFREPERIFTGLQGAIRRALLAYTPVPGLQAQLRWAPENPPAPTSRQIDPAWNLDQVSARKGWQVEMQPELDRQPTDELPGGAAHALAGQPSFPDTRVPILRLVGQVANAYLVAEGPDGLYLIDQHAAHERVLFERFMSQLPEVLPSQSLLQPATVDLPPANARLLTDQLPFLARLGFQVETFGPHTFLVRAVPNLLAGSDPAAALRVLVEDFEEDETPLQAEREARLVARVCKRAAVKAGHALSPDEQRALLSDLEACQSPRTCPHGRPTMIHLSVDLLERQFGRRGAR